MIKLLCNFFKHKHKAILSAGLKLCILIILLDSTLMFAVLLSDHGARHKYRSINSSETKVPPRDVITGQVLFAEERPEHMTPPYTIQTTVT